MRFEYHVTRQLFNESQLRISYFSTAQSFMLIYFDQSSKCEGNLLREVLREQKYYLETLINRDGELETCDVAD